MRFELATDPYPASVNPLQPYRRKRLPGVMVEGDWTQELAGFYAEQRIEALYLNASRGWTGTDYAFLAELPWLRVLDIVAGRCSDLSAVGNLAALQEASLGCTTGRAVDFSGLTSLERCSLEWWDGASSVFACTGLRSLSLHQLPAERSAGLAGLGNLRDLTIYSQSLRSLETISGLAQLEKLELLGVRKLESLHGIEHLTSLRSLTVNGCSRVSDLTSLARLENLEHLVLSDWKAIDTLEPLRNLAKLRALSFAGARTTVVDGDLSPLEELPRLSMLMFAPRRHYTHRLVKPWNWANFDEPDVLLARKRG